MELIGERKQQVTPSNNSPTDPTDPTVYHPLPLSSTCSGTVHAVIYEVDISIKTGLSRSENH